MKLCTASTVAIAATLSSAAIAAPMTATMAAPMTATMESSEQASHDLRTFTDAYGITLLIDYGNPAYVGLEAGIAGIDGIYGPNEPQATDASGMDTWVDMHNGMQAVIDYAHPNYYTVYDSAHSPVATISNEQPTPESTAPSHYLMTFVNDKGYQLLVDAGVENVGILEAGIDGVDGVYTVPSGGFPHEDGESGMETWIDSADGIKAVIDLANPNHYTVYDASDNPIQTV